jgi:hypothetical protein
MPFQPYFDQTALDQLFNELMGSNFGSVYDATRRPPLKGIYALFDGESPVYVGRTMKRGLGPRMRNHITRNHNQAVLAFKRARAKFGNTALKRNELDRDPSFRPVFQEQIEWVKSLRCRFAEIEDEKMQYVFEFYSALRLQAPYNDFNTH